MSAFASTSSSVNKSIELDFLGEEKKTDFLEGVIITAIILSR